MRPTTTSSPRAASDNGPVNLLSNGAGGGNGVYSYSSTTTFPTSTFNATNYWVDVVFNATGTTPPDTTPPTVSSDVAGGRRDRRGDDHCGQRDLQRGDGCGDDQRVDLRAAQCGQRARRIDGQLRRADAHRDADADRGTGGLARPTPRPCAAAAPIRASRTSPAMRWRPTSPGRSRPPRHRAPNCPCSAWRVDDADHAAVRTRTRSSSASSSDDVDGFITGIRFYKGDGNTGTHVGNLWSAGGALLARGHLHQRDGLGLAAGELRDAGRRHRQHGLRRLVLRAERPTTRPTATTSRPAASTTARSTCSERRQRRQRRLPLLSATTFPTSTFNSTNYWVDVVFSTTGTTPPDTTPPTVTATSPANGATGVATNTAVTATFSEAMDAATVQRVHLRAAQRGQRAGPGDRQLRRGDAAPRR